jgi:hypothetical protein
MVGHDSANTVSDPLRGVAGKSQCAGLEDFRLLLPDVMTIPRRTKPDRKPNRVHQLTGGLPDAERLDAGCTTL